MTPRSIFPLALTLVCSLLPTATQALVLETRFTLSSGGIPDGDPNGRADLRNISGIDGWISDVDVYLRLRGTGLDGGWNGDVYAALRHDSGYAVLLNRPGRANGLEYGSGGDGFDVWLDDTAAEGDVHHAPSSRSLWQGNWAPDGRNLGPLASTTEFTTAPRTALLSVFHGLPVSGDWSLLVIDASSGGQVELAEWGLRVSYQTQPPTSSVPDSTAPWELAGLGLTALLGFRRLTSAR